jgi:imidazole glycerol phosphate synthase glutamine amidotransferase subunit
VIAVAVRKKRAYPLAYVIIIDKLKQKTTEEVVAKEVHENINPHPLLEGLSSGTYFYFVHSYHIETERRDVVVAETEYGIRYPSVCARGSVCGVQFHPEKSQDAGLRLLANFASM